MAWRDGSHDGVFLVSCDWFAVSCVLDAPRGDRLLSVPRDWSVVPMASTAVWADRFFILDGVGNKVATLLCTPRTPRLDSRRALVQIANRYLYAEEFHAVCDAVLSSLPMAVTGLNRVDLCCDFEMTDRMWKTYSALADGSAYVKALREGAVWWQSVAEPYGCADVGRLPHCLTFGGHESIFKWKVYYKWLELQQAPPEDKKPYITDLWNAAGMDEKCVWRIEVSVSGTNKLVGGDGLRLPAFEWYDKKVEVFRDLYADKFEVRMMQGHKDKRNDKMLPFLNIDGLKSLWHGKPLSERDDSDCERRLVCKLWDECQSCDVQANRAVFDMLRGNIVQLCEKESNLWALKRSFGVSIDDVMALMAK